ncbi:MAG TPA: TadE/TadG family type IV pilus assembly protein [Candidatus Cybelea sp.]|nr:TadE/TadG family type IV pilus assembly protein [Candidatus Cybelea sp.]
MTRSNEAGQTFTVPERGGVAVEFAFILIVLMTIVLGIMDFGRALYAYHFVSHAAKSAARWAAVNGATCGAPSSTCDSCDNSCNGTPPMNNGPASAGDIESYVTSLAPPGINTSALTTTANWTSNADSPAVCTQAVGGIGPYENYPGCTVQVQVRYQFTFLFPLVSNKTLTLSGTSEMVIAH